MKLFKKIPSLSEIVIIALVIFTLATLCETGIWGMLLSAIAVIFIIRVSGKIY